MPLLDNSKQCDIITSSFLEDLQNYSIVGDNIKWQDNSANLNYTIKNNINLFENNADGPTSWTPNFIQDDNLVDNKLISHYGSIKGDSIFSSGRIGIEDFISFTPRFKSWTVSNNNMVIDWILNRSRSPYTIMYGLNYWKKNSQAITGSIESFPLYSKIKHNNIEYIKLDNSTLRRLTVKQNVFNNNADTITFNYTQTNADTQVSSLGNNITFTLVGSDQAKVWIPDGDQLLYFLNRAELDQNFTNNIGTRSYISGSLYKYYNIFYNSLTADENTQSLTGDRNIKKFRLYKKLAHSLATSPFCSEFFVAFLAKPSNAIKNAITAYLNSNSGNVDTDITNLTTILNIISTEYSSYEINNNSNIVTNNNELFLKLIHKYGAKLKFSNSSSISFRPRLTHGDSLIIEEIGDTFVNKTAANATVSNNKIISLNKLKIETSMENSSILLKDKNSNTTLNNIHLYNSVKPSILPSSTINIALEKNNNVKNDNNRIPTIVDYDPNNNVFYWGPGSIDDNMTKWLLDCPKLKVLNFDLLKKYTNSRFPNQAEDLVSNEFLCTWEKISGPNLKFVDLNKTQTNKTYNRAYGNEVMIVPYSTGKYVIRCVVSGPFGSYTKIKTIFIVDGREKIIRPNVGLVDNGNFNKYSSNPSSDNLFANIINADTDVTITPSIRSENSPISINNDNLNVSIATQDSFAIHRNGLYSPIRTNYYVEKVNNDSRPIEKLDENYQFLFNETAGTISSPQLDDSSLRIDYVCNTTIIKLERIILRNIRNSTNDCSQCYSLYKPKLRSFVIRRLSGNNSTSFQRSNRFPDGFTLQKYLQDGQNRYFPSETQNYFYPIISTDFSAPIKTYGGYGHKVLDKLNIQNLNSLNKPAKRIENNNLIAGIPNSLPSVTGYKLDYKDDYTSLSDSVRDYKLCYQENVMPSGFIEFHKGTFIPNSGWLIGDNRNLSSVLKFNPGARKSFSFAGPGILGLSNYSNTDNILPNIFSSSIELTINPSIRWSNGCLFQIVEGNETQTQNNRARVVGNHNIKNAVNTEFQDQLISSTNAYHHGYRMLGGGFPKNAERNLIHNSSPVNDEFDFKINEDNNSFIYGFNVVGPNNTIPPSQESRRIIQSYIVNGQEPGGEGEEAGSVKDFILNNNEVYGLRNPRINNLQIKDIEVQLNFLNYVNTKNLIIWLEVEFSDLAKQRIALRPSIGNSPPSAPAQIISSNNFIDQFISNDTHKAFAGVNNSFSRSSNIPITNSSIRNYLEKLTDTNSRDSVGEKTILYLLNQETIQNKEYNFSVKFSDSASKHNVFFDHNMFSSGAINPDQNIITNNNSINPSKITTGYNTYNNSMYSNLNKNNRLNINNNTFHKFSDMILFHGVNPETRAGQYLFPAYDSSTKFTLKIAVLDEEDEMTPMDTSINTSLFSNLSSVENQIVPGNIFNNLCSWELILHTEDVKKPITSQINSLANYGGSDSLGLIEYGTQPKYPGYGFIANLSDSKFLLPLVNMNAPSAYYQNYNACEYADNELIGKGVLINAPRFPTEALILILAGTAVGGMSGTLVGTLIGGLGPTYYLGFELLFAYYRASRQIPVLENIQREVFDIDYESYPFGNSDKILLNVSKDEVFWYKVEASIFKLSNTPALPPKEYSLITQNNNSKLFTFNFSIVSQNSDIIDEIFIPYIVAAATPDNADDETIENYQNINNEVYDSFDFMSVNELVYLNKLIIGDNNIQQDIFLRKRLEDTLIIIDNTLSFYLIDINDRIRLEYEIIASRDSSSNIFREFIQVTSKALVYKDSRYQTILAVSTNQIGDKLRPGELASYSSIRLVDRVIAFADNGFSTYYDSENISSISLFGLTNNQPPCNNIPELNFSTNSLGSYGDGSSVKDKNILSRKIKVNNINSIYDEINSFNNDKYYFNKITYKNSDGITETIKEKFSAYPVYYDSNLNAIIDNKFYHLYDKAFTNIDSDLSSEELGKLLDNINTSIKNYSSYMKDQPKNLMFLKFHRDRDRPTAFESSEDIELRWNTTFFGFLDGDPWTINNTKLTINFEDSRNCEGSNNSTQSAFATTTIIPNKNYRLEIEIEGKAELQDAGFELLRIELNNVLIAEAFAEGGKKECEMGPVVVRKPVVWSPLLAGEKYILSVDVTTGDPLFHVGAYYNIRFKFLNPEPEIISIENNYTYNKTIERITQSQLSSLVDRLKALNVTEDTKLDPLVGIVSNTNRILDSNSIFYIQQHYDILNSNVNAIGARQQTYNILQKLYKEKSEILELLENQALRRDNGYILNPEKQVYHTGAGGIIPDYRAIISTNTTSGALNNSINIVYENISDNYYWINIDPKQSISIAEEMRPRILKSIKYRCQSVNAAFSAVGVGAQVLDFNNVCPDFLSLGTIAGSNSDFTIDDGAYKLKQNILDAKKTEWELKGASYGWKDQIITRRFRVNSDKNIKNIIENTDFLVEAEEIYEVAQTAIENGGPLEGDDGSADIVLGGLLDSNGSRNGATRVYNIFNLDDTASLKVQFRKAPRSMRGIDAIGTVLRYGENISYRPQNRPPLDPLDIFGVDRPESLINNFYQWKCLQKNPSNNMINDASTPDFFKLLNEMIFRTFFGSADGIENKTPQLKSLYDFEMIPYEYFTKPPPP
jgi:hypothetical protein